MNKTTSTQYKKEIEIMSQLKLDFWMNKQLFITWKVCEHSMQIKQYEKQKMQETRYKKFLTLVSYPSKMHQYCQQKSKMWWMTMTELSIKDSLIKLVELQLSQISLNFTTSCWNLRVRGLGAKLCSFCTVVILKGIMTFQSHRVHGFSWTNIQTLIKTETTKTEKFHTGLRPKYTIWLIIYDFSDSLAVLRKIRNVSCKHKCDILYNFWFYIKEELKEELILCIKKNSLTDNFQRFCLKFKNTVSYNPSQWLFPKKLNWYIKPFTWVC